MTYLQLCQQMVRDLGLSISISTVTGQTGMALKIVNWVADADIHIQSLYFDWNFLESQHSANTIAGTKDYSKPDDFGTWDKDSFFLDYATDDYINLGELDYRIWKLSYGPGTHENDEPSQFVIKPDNSIILDPAPDKIYALTADYWKTPTRMSGNTDTSPIPDRFERIILAQAKIYYAEHDEFPAVYEMAVREYNDILPRLEASELPNREAFGMSHADLRIIPE